MPYLDDVKGRMKALLIELPVNDRESEMDEVVATLSDQIAESPRRLTADSFVTDVFASPAMKSLVEKDAKNRLALSAETPSELATNLLPSDGHLE